MWCKLSPDKRVIPCTVFEMEQVFDGDRTVKKTVVEGKYYISTAFLGHNVGFGSSQFFETMVFPCNSEGEVIDYSDIYCERYETWNEAVDGHWRTVERFKNA